MSRAGTGRKWAHFAEPDPPQVVKLAADKPACFDAASWRVLLLDFYRGTVQDRANQRRVKDGQAPNYCRGCTADYRARMKGEDRCHPPEEPSA